ncbi:MAG: hypothetical protein U0640_08390 [Phycisphaerales bacterium]
MILSAITILMLALLAFIWANRGFYSALIHMVCTIAAGAIAFGVWEPLAYMLLDASPQRGMMSALGGVAWALALAVPFAVSLALLRLAADAILGSNVIVTTAVNYIGASICGIVAATIAVGIFTISISNLRFVPGLASLAPIQSSAVGSMTRQEKLIVPFDTMVAGIYGSMSEHALATDTPLAKWHPDAGESGYTLRQTYEGKARNTIKPKDFDVIGRVTITAPKFSDLLKDAFDSASQNVEDLSGGKFPEDTRVEAFALRFSSTGGESSGKIVIGNAQYRLIAENEAGNRITLFPFAVSSQADGSDPRAGRWRFNAKDTFISSVGGASEAYFLFEFPMPNGYQPIALYARGVRVKIDSSIKQLGTFKSAKERDAVIPSLAASLKAGKLEAVDLGGNKELDVSSAEAVTWTETTPIKSLMITNAIGYTIQKGLHSPMEIDEKNQIIQGERVFTLKEISEMGNVDRNLRIANFFADSDVQLVKVDVSAESEFSFLKPIVANAPSNAAALLVDSNGQTYSPVGLIYKDDNLVKIRYTPAAPMGSLGEIAQYGTMSRSRPEAKLSLIFRISRGVSLKYFAIGNRAMVEVSPILPIRR